MVPVKEFAKQVRREFKIEDNKKYKILGLRLEGRGLFIREEKFGREIKSDKLFQVRKGDFIYSRLFAWRGAFDIVSEQFDNSYVSSEFPCFEIEKNKADAEFLLKYFLRRGILKKVEALCTGTTRLSRNRFKEDKFLDFEINIPQLEHQIVVRNKVNSISKSNRDLNTIHEENLSLIQKLHQTILGAAFSGKLVPQDPNDEPASDLLKKLEAEREKSVREKKIKRQKPLTPISKDEIPYELPKGWEWVRLGDIFRFIDYRGKTPPKIESGVRLITAKNVKQGYVTKEPQEFISESTYEKWMTRGLPKIGDLLITTEAPLGHVAILDIQEKVAFAQRVIILQTSCDLNSYYLKYMLMSDPIQKLIIGKQSGMTAKGIKSSKLKTITVPFPSLSEQKRIVEKIDQLMKLCDELEEKVKENLENSKILMEAVLKEAFAS